MVVPQRTIVTRVVVPAALPSLMVALRLGVATSWTAVVAAELIGAPSGLGYAVEWYRELLMTPQVMAFIAMIGVLGYVCDRLARMLSRVFAPWATSQATT
jgi:ABC-type nitrate/sulfonate/bicarbonate transport system permease component